MNSASTPPRTDRDEHEDRVARRANQRLAIAHCAIICASAETLENSSRSVIELIVRSTTAVSNTTRTYLRRNVASTAPKSPSTRRSPPSTRSGRCTESYVAWTCGDVRSRCESPEQSCGTRLIVLQVRADVRASRCHCAAARLRTERFRAPCTACRVGSRACSSIDRRRGGPPVAPYRVCGIVPESAINLRRDARRLQRFQHLGLGEHSSHIEAFERISLHHLNDARREVLADVAEPARNARK